MVPPRSPSAARFCRPSSLIHSVIRPTTGSSVSPNSVRARAFEARRVPRAPRCRPSACRGRCRRTARCARGRSGRWRSCPRCRARRSRRGRGWRASARASAAISASGCSNNSASSQRMLTLTRLARPPWTSASVSDLIGVLQADIFADHADRHFAFGIEQAVDDVVPARHVGRGRVVDAEGAQHFAVEPVGMILGGDGVDARRVERRDHRFLADVAEHARSWRARCRAAAVRSGRRGSSGWMPSAVSSRTLCWVGLVFSSPAAAI